MKLSIRRFDCRICGVNTWAYELPTRWESRVVRIRERGLTHLATVHICGRCNLYRRRSEDEVLEVHATGGV
jgi:hypothetical protein